MAGQSHGSVCERSIQHVSLSGETTLPAVDISTGDTVKINLSKPRQPITQDDHAVETAISLLAQSGVAELRFLRVDESAEEICLSGRVGSYYHKQLAQETVRAIAGGRQVVNRVHVSAS